MRGGGGHTYVLETCITYCIAEKFCKVKILHYPQYWQYLNCKIFCWIYPVNILFDIHINILYCSCVRLRSIMVLLRHFLAQSTSLPDPNVSLSSKPQLIESANKKVSLPFVSDSSTKDDSSGPSHSLYAPKTVRTSLESPVESAQLFHCLSSPQQHSDLWDCALPRTF